MMKFSKVDNVIIPEGKVRKIRSSGKILWQPTAFRYVSFGDSIAAGHAMELDWDEKYGERSQYGENGNTETVIIPGTYTDLIRQELANIYDGRISTTSFAHSGYQVNHVMTILDHTGVRNTVAKADLVTLCIGANDVLTPCLENLETYFAEGRPALAEIENTVIANLGKLRDDSNANSYNALFKKLTSINPHAKFVFTTVYNPYKYLWMDEGRKGFFKPVMDLIPDIDILGFNVDAMLETELMKTDIFQVFFNRINGLGDWAENYVSQLNDVLRQKINEYGNPNFLLADTKSLYDYVPDRPVTATKHYNDLVNVEITRGYKADDLWLTELWREEGSVAYWWNLVTPHVSTSGIDFEAIGKKLISDVTEKVIIPDIDPHPETYGHYMLKRSFADVLGWQSLDRHTVTFNANGGSGSMSTQEIISVDGLPGFATLKVNAFTNTTTGYRFTGWNTKADGSGTSYTNGQFISLAGDMTLYAQWSNIYELSFKKSYYDKIGDLNDSHSGQTDHYELWIAGEKQTDLGAFSTPARVYRLPYGTRIGVVARVYDGDAESYVSYNGANVTGTSTNASWEFDLTSNTMVNFEWNVWMINLISLQKHWECHITTY